MFNNQTFTLTFGDQAENHVGMQKISNLSGSLQAIEGYHLIDLERAKEWFEHIGLKPILYDIKFLLQNSSVMTNGNIDEIEDAYILVIPGGLDAIVSSDKFFQEQMGLPKDTKAYMYGRVVNKRARYNLCFNHESQEPNYEEGKGSIIAFKDVPLLNTVRISFEKIFGEKGKDLVAEGNYYYDINCCGIGYHGDSERKRVIGVRVGESLPLRYQWFHKNKAVGNTGQLILNHGDIYIMSEKATGNDWKKRNIYTLRHAAGALKYITYKPRKK